MALITLDAKTALIVIDLQQGIVGSPFIARQFGRFHGGNSPERS
jgi:hypothetical protein